MGAAAKFSLSTLNQSGLGLRGLRDGVPMRQLSPLASNLKLASGQTIPNAIITQIGGEGNVCLFNSQATHLVADATGYFP